jgi:hypothetical protein
VRKQLGAMLISYNLTSKVYFATRIQNKSYTAVGNIFINTLHSSNFLVTSLVNGLSDHDAKLLTIEKTNVTKSVCYTKTVMDRNKQ